MTECKKYLRTFHNAFTTVDGMKLTAGGVPGERGARALPPVVEGTSGGAGSVTILHLHTEARTARGGITALSLATAIQRVQVGLKNIVEIIQKTTG